MTILTLEFSSPQRSVAVARGGNVLAEAGETGGRNTAAFGMIEKVLAEAKIGREEIDTIAVGLGPGSYTGIRAAISLAQGWQLAFAEPEQDNSSQTMASAQRRLAREIKLLGIGSAEAIAAQAQAEKIFGRVNVVVDAQRNEFYLAAYDVSEGGWREIEPLKILPFEEVQSRATGGEILIGPEVTKWFPNGRTVFPRAAVLAKLAASRKDFVAGETLEPVYLRAVDFVKSPPCRTPAA
jgi:tRNA threonylcarbamoyladenosine biosynthesis protein TsaB